MPSPLLLALRARGGGGGPLRQPLSRLFLLYRQEQQQQQAGLALAGVQSDRPDHHRLPWDQHDPQQRRTMFSFFGGKRGGGGGGDASSAASAAAATESAESAESAEAADSLAAGGDSSLDAAFALLPRVFRPGAAMEQAVHDLGGIPEALELGAAATGAAAAAAAAALPWAASLPLATLALKLALTPLSLRSAAVVRSNMRLWTEAAGLAEQRAAKAAHQQRQEEGEAAAAAKAGGAGGATGAAPGATAAETGQASTRSRLELASARMAVYGELRRQCGVPSPLWALANVAVQVPTFFYVASSIRAMSGVGAAAVLGGGGAVSGGGEDENDESGTLIPPPPWPGFQTEGALWFPDLAAPATVPLDAAASAAAEAAAAAAASSSTLAPWLASAGLQLAPASAASPAAALALPVLTTLLSVLAIRRGIAASGGARALAALPGARDSPLLRLALANLPRAAYAAAVGALYFKLQAAPAVLLHWLASLSYTLALQQAVARSAAVRRAMGLPPPPRAAALVALEALASAAGARAAALATNAVASVSSSSSSSSSPFTQTLQLKPTDGPVPEGAEVLTPQQFLARVKADQAEREPDVLVVMAAHHSSRGDSLSALYCLDLALAADPSHARARYARGQARSMARDWDGAERDYCAAADALLLPPRERRRRRQEAGGEAAGEAGEGAPAAGDGHGGDHGNHDDDDDDDAGARRLLRGQALYAAGGAAAGAGRHARALQLYDQAARWWTVGGGGGGSGRGGARAAAAAAAASASASAAAAYGSARHAPALLALARARSLAALERRREAADVLERALSAGQRASVTEGLRAMLLDARRRVLSSDWAAAAAHGGGGGGGGEDRRGGGGGRH